MGTELPAITSSERWKTADHYVVAAIDALRVAQQHLLAVDSPRAGTVAREIAGHVETLRATHRRCAPHNGGLRR